MTLGDIIKKYREENSITMEQVAVSCGITKGYVSMLEKNVNSKTGRPVKPTIETILKVCQGLHLDVDEVFDLLDNDYVIKISGSPKVDFVLTNLDRRLLDSFHCLNSHGQKKMVDYAADLMAAEKYQSEEYFRQCLGDENAGSTLNPDTFDKDIKMCKNKYGKGTLAQEAK